MTNTKIDELREKVIAALCTVHDPEIPVNIYDLGLIYDLDVTPDGDVHVRMTLTSPNCPVAEALPGQVEKVIGTVDGIRDTKVELVWEPPWSLDRMSEAARLELNMHGVQDSSPPFMPVDSVTGRDR
jgi:FeS assembly SUF system protein